MLSTLSPHLRAPNAVRPTPSYLETYIVSDKTGHWFWDVRPYGHRHNQQGQAVVSTYADRTHGKGIFTVARLLLEDRYKGLPSRTKIECKCGLPQCINPTHWRLTFPQPRFRLKPLLDGGWKLVSTCDGTTLTRAACIHVTDDTVTHVVDAIPGQELRARCGRVFVLTSTVVVTMLPTCESCRR